MLVISSLLADYYDPSKQYSPQEFCIYENLFYKCIKKTNIGNFEPEKWMKAYIVDIIRGSKYIGPNTHVYSFQVDVGLSFDGGHSGTTYNTDYEDEQATIKLVFPYAGLFTTLSVDQYRYSISNDASEYSASLPDIHGNDFHSTFVLV